MSSIIPLLLSLILMLKSLASVFRITNTLSPCGVTKPMNIREVSSRQVTSILCDPGGTNLLKWPR